MNHTAIRSEQGQSAVIVALVMFAMVGMLALALDGGNTFLQRRVTQNAADAGALAGARELCVTGDATQAANRALEYAINRNGALEADATVESGVVTVNARILFQPWFAAVLGQPEVTVGAVASAGCFAPSGGTGILPVAWSCRPPAGETELTNCDRQYGKLYVVMDSGSTSEDIYCQNPPNDPTAPGVDCDYDDDGTDDVIAGGDRSWLDLDGGGGGSSELVNWVNGGFAGEINYHTWFAGQTGVANNVFQAAGDRVGQVLIIPVFDKYCDQPGALPETSCPWLYDPEDTTVAGGGASAFYYHVITFSLFQITCVDAPGVPGGQCPGKQAAVQAGSIPNNAKTIEGYFLEGFVQGISGKPVDGVDGGAYTLYLIQ